MAKTLQYPTDRERLAKELERTFQSAQINFLLGSGASLPAVPLMGNLENEVEELYEAGNTHEADKQLYDFLKGTYESVEQLTVQPLNADLQSVMDNYGGFLQSVEEILLKRSAGILERQVSIFTTNYDPFIEAAAEAYRGIRVNDGFERYPGIASTSRYSAATFFTSLYGLGQVFNYRAEIPSINLVKLHGSLTWKASGDHIEFTNAKRELVDSEDQVAVQEFLSESAIILPRKAKFKQSLLDRIYYDQLRLLANQLDKENTLLLSFGFSFADEHIYDIVIRALRNPTLRLVVFAFDRIAAGQSETKFENYSNVVIVSPEEGETIDFTMLNKILKGAVSGESDE